MPPLICHVVSHTHWDREWYQPFQEFRIRLVAMMDRLLVLLDADPEYRHFMLDGQTIILQDYLAVRPDRLADLRRHVASGRLLVGPWYILPDEFLVSPESLVRNLQAGRRAAVRFGASMPVGYIPDTFGHVSQLPQVFAGFGIDSAVVWRGLPDAKNAFMWAAPHGQVVTCLNLHEGYGDLAWAPSDPAGFAAVVRQVVARLAPHAIGGQVLLMDGTDHLEARPDLPGLIAAANESLAGEDIRLVHSTLPAYLAALRSAALRLDVMSGEFRSPRRNNILPGVLSTRMWIKQRNRELETLLSAWSEPMSAIALAIPASDLGLEAASVDGLMAEAWRLLLQNQPHDSVCGCSVDQVHEEMRSRYDQAEQVGAEVSRRALAAVAGLVDTRPPWGGEAIPVVVFNPVGHAATGAVEVTVQAPPWWDGLEVADQAGHSVPFDVTAVEEVPFSALGIDDMDVVTRLPVESAERIVGQSVLRLTAERRGGELVIRGLLGGHGLGDPVGIAAAAAEIRALMAAEPGLKPRLEAAVVPHTRLSFVARDLPALGYATYFVRLHPSAWAAHEPHWLPADSNGDHIENEFLHLVAEEETGTLTLTDKRTGTALAGLNRFVDDGDRGDEYNFCPVGREASIDRPVGRPDIFVTRRSDSGMELVVCATYALPAELTLDRSRRRARRVNVYLTSRVRLTPGVPRLDIETEVDNRVLDHRLRVAFPLPWAPPTWRTETPWDVVERPVSPPDLETDPRYDDWQERPVAQQPQGRFCDVNVPGAGLTLANRGLPEVEARSTPGISGVATTLYLTLLRCVGWLSRSDLPVRKGHAGPGLSTPGAQCPGTQRFAYSLIPHGGDWQTVLPLVESFEAPPRAVTTVARAGALPPRHSFVSVDDPAVAVSALKRSEDGRALVLRLWNASAQSVSTTVRLGLPVNSARLARLDEMAGDALPLGADGVTRVSLGARQAVTILLYPK